MQALVKFAAGQGNMELRVTGSFSQKFWGWEKALEFCAKGLIKAKPVITHTFSLGEWQMAFDLFENAEAIKVIFDMNEKKINGDPKT